MFRKVLFWLHLTVGITVGLVVFIMSVTGVALTYQRQTQAWADGFDVRPAEASVQPMPVAELLRQARTDRDEVPTALLLRNDPAKPVRISFGRQSVELNPYTGEALGAGAVGVRRMFRVLMGWHRWLGQEGEGRALGRAITGFCNLAFLFIVISGLYLWWPASWSWSRLRSILFFRRGLAAKPRHFNWHSVFGFWTAIPLAILVATGAFFSYSWPSGLIYWITGEERPQRRGAPTPAAAPEEPPPPEDYEGMDALVLAALQEEPAWSLATFRFVPGPETPVTVTLDRSSMGTRRPAHHVDHGSRDSDGPAGGSAEPRLQSPHLGSLAPHRRGFRLPWSDNRWNCVACGVFPGLYGLVAELEAFPGVAAAAEPGCPPGDGRWAAADAAPAADRGSGVASASPCLGFSRTLTPAPPASWSGRRGGRLG